MPGPWPDKQHGAEAVNHTVDKLHQLQELKMPCANGPCQNPAIHVVAGTFSYPEKVRSGKPDKGFRWEVRVESFLLYMCRDHRNKWLRSNAEFTVGRGLL